MAELLSSLASVKAWLRLTTTTDDDLIGRLLLGASQAILGYIQRPTLLSGDVTETYNGTGSTRLMLRQWPVTAVAAVSIDGVAVSASTSPPMGSGFMSDVWDGLGPGTPGSVYVVGRAFTRGWRNISVTYTRGYRVSDEEAAIPSTSPYQVAPAAPRGPWAADCIVKLASTGAAFTKVTGTPAAGQYSVGLTGVYTFNAADAGKAILLSYSYVPADIENACFEMIGEQFKSRDRIGETSRSIGGQETVSFSQKAMNEYAKLLLQPYRAVLPI